MRTWSDSATGEDWQDCPADCIASIDGDGDNDDANEQAIFEAKRSLLVLVQSIPHAPTKPIEVDELVKKNEPRGRTPENKHTP